MAPSPSSHSLGLHNMAATSLNARYRLNPPSPSPPPQPSLNKRDKKRQAMTERLTEISNNFAENRDFYYRERLQSFHNDIKFINDAQLYNNEALDDSYGEPGPSQSTVRGGASQTNGRQPPNARVLSTPKLGKHAANFVQDVNDALEEKDAQLTRLADDFSYAVDQLRKDYEFNIRVAEEESKRLTDVLRQRLIANVQAKKAALQKDKEKLDIADTNALLYHPNQFSINNAASPIGPQGNRKTRHTRHRLEADEFDATNTVNGKRKRKGAFEADNGSPTRDLEPPSAVKALENGIEEASGQTYTVDRLFTDKELNSHLQWASLKVIEEQQAIKRRKLRDGSGVRTADASEAEDEMDGPGGEAVEPANGDTHLEAPSMERSATNQSYHATRSTRTLNLINGATRENLGELAGRQAAAALIGTYHREKKKEDDYNRAAPLSNEDVEHDFALMAKAIKAEDQKRQADDSLLQEAIVDRPNYIWMPPGQ